MYGQWGIFSRKYLARIIRGQVYSQAFVVSQIWTFRLEIHHRSYG